MDETRIDGKVVDPGGQLLPPIHLKGSDAFRWALDQGQAVWFANPVLWLGCVLLALRRWILVGLAGTVAVALAILPVIETPPDLELKSTLLVGYWIWVASMALLGALGWLGCYVATGRGIREYQAAT